MFIVTLFTMCGIQHELCAIACVPSIRNATTRYPEINSGFISVMSATSAIDFAIGREADVYTTLRLRPALLDTEITRQQLHSFGDITEGIGHPQLRHVGTITGNRQSSPSDIALSPLHVLFGGHALSASVPGGTSMTAMGMISDSW